jgi:hypothetical protein
MYVLGVVTILFALPRKAMSILALSFLIQIMITPAAGNSLSFILSYLAMLGILIIGKALPSLLAGKIPDFILKPLSISTGAFLATAGVCGFVFGIIADDLARGAHNAQHAPPLSYFRQIYLLNGTQSLCRRGVAGKRHQRAALLKKPFYALQSVFVNGVETARTIGRARIVAEINIIVLRQLPLNIF